MTLSEISNARLINQKISTPEFNSALEVVRWMGAIQAQDYQMAKWAIGTRLSYPTDQKIVKDFYQQLFGDKDIYLQSTSI